MYINYVLKNNSTHNPIHSSKENAPTNTQMNTYSTKTTQQKITKENLNIQNLNIQHKQDQTIHIAYFNKPLNYTSLKHVLKAYCHKSH